MSIINQALKKAQRERLLHETQTIPHLTRLSPSRHSRRRLLIVVGLVLALGGGAVLRSRSMAPTRQATVGDRDRLALGPRNTARWRPLKLPHPSPLPPPPLSERGERRSASAAPSVQARSRARDLFNQAVETQKAGQQTRALALLQQAIKLDPDLKEAYNTLGNLFYQQHKYHQALTVYQKVLAIDPDYAKARNNLGSTYLRLGMDERAVEELHRALRADDTYALAYYNLACVYARAGDSTTAAQYLQHAIAIEPQARTWAQTDDDFSRVRTAPEMQQLLGPS